MKVKKKRKTNKTQLESSMNDTTIDDDGAKNKAKEDGAVKTSQKQNKNSTNNVCSPLAFTNNPQTHTD